MVAQPRDRFTDPVEMLLERLDRVRQTRDGWSASCPSSTHRRGDKSPSLSVGRGADGKALLWCGAGCDLERDILPPIGLEIRDLFPPREESAPKRRKPKRGRFALDPEVANRLLSSGEFRVAWIIAMQLARLPARRARVEMVAAWDAITRLADPKLVNETADLIRGVALFAFGDAAEMEPVWSDELEDYVGGDGLDKAVARLERSIARTLRGTGVAA